MSDRKLLLKQAAVEMLMPLKGFIYQLNTYGIPKIKEDGKTFIERSDLDNFKRLRFVNHRRAEIQKRAEVVWKKRKQVISEAKQTDFMARAADREYQDVKRSDEEVKELATTWGQA